MSCSTECSAWAARASVRITVRRLIAAAWLTGAAAANATYLVTDIGATLQSPYNYASDLNNANQMVGTLWDRGVLVNPGMTHGFLADATSATRMVTNPGALEDTQAVGLNDQGQVVGYTRLYSRADYSSVTTATLWSGSNATSLQTLGGTAVSVSDINNAGQIVGGSATAAGTVHATLWSGGAVTDLGALGGGSSEAKSINASGQVVGTSTTGGVTRATLWSDGQIIDLGGSSLYSSSALKINDNGQTVGYLYGQGTQRPVLWNGAVMTELPTLGGANGIAYGINNLGQVVGTSQDARGVYRATLWNGTEAVDLNSLIDPSQITFHSYLDDAHAINDQGAIAARSVSTEHAVLLTATPVPEPEAAGLLLLGLGVMGQVARRRRRHSVAVLAA